MSFHFRRHAPAQKRAQFTNTGESRPSKKVKVEPPVCTYCSMKSVTRCELPDCSMPLCAKHVIRKAGGSRCPRHKKAILVQYDGLPNEKFGNRGGEAVPHVLR